ncbi:hypothetical protein ACOMHN_052690 [Nucella lapillus]
MVLPALTSGPTAELTMTTSVPCQSASPKVMLAGGESNDRLDDDQRGVMNTTSGGVGRVEEDGGTEVREEEAEEEQCRLLKKSEMDRYTLQPMDNSSSGRSETGEGSEMRELMDKPVERPVRTCAVLCGAFFLVYTANLAIQNLQTSLHQTAGLGITSLAVLYGSIIVFGSLSPLVIRFLTAKRTLVLAFICHLLYTLSNFYPTIPTLLTSSLLLGAMAGPMWTAQGLYCTATGLAYAGIKQV